MLLFSSSAFATPPFFIVTAPELTAKLSELNDAIPLLEVVASSPAIVTVLAASSLVTSIPSPAVTTAPILSFITSAIVVPPIVKASVSKVPSTSTSPDISRLANTEVPVAVTIPVTFIACEKSNSSLVLLNHQLQLSHLMLLLLHL